MLVEVPSPIPIAGEDKHDSIIMSSNQNMKVQNTSKKPNQQPNQPPHNPSADIILCNPSERLDRDTSGTMVDKIIKDIEKSSGLKTLRHSERLNPPQTQPSEQELWCSKQLKQHQAANLLIAKDLETDMFSAMISMMDQIIDPPSVKAVKKQKDWPEWEASIKVELDIHKELDTGELVTAPLNINIVGGQIILCYKLDKDSGISSCKSRLVSQGFTQQLGVNFNDIFPQWLS